MIADRNIYLDKTSTKLVREGSAESAFQLVNAGREIPAEDVERLGLYLDKEGKVAQKGAEPDKEPEMPNPQKPAPEKKPRKGKGK